MKVVMLAAGYATRLESVTDGGKIAKTMLSISDSNGKKQPMLYHLLDKINEVNNPERNFPIDEIVIVTNEKYRKQIFEACKNYGSWIDIKIISNGCKDKSESKGANADLQLGLDYVKGSGADVMILASDNYFDFSLVDLMNEFDNKSVSDDDISMIVTKTFPEEKKDYYHNGFAIVESDENGLITNFVEKPAKDGIEINSHDAAIALYLLRSSNVKLIDKYMEKYNDLSNPVHKKKRDSLGYFGRYITKHSPTYNYSIGNSLFIDIGTPEEYAKVSDYKLKQEKSI